MNEAAALPSPPVLLSGRLSSTTAASDSLRHPPTSRLITGYRTRRSDSTNPTDRRAGEGLPSSRRHHPNVPRPLRRGVPRGCTSRLFTPSMAFTQSDGARLSLIHAHDAAGFAYATDRSVAHPQRMLDAALRPQTFPPETGSLLPGLLAATRTGPTPAGDDGLSLITFLISNLRPLGALRIVVELRRRRPG